MISLLAIAIAFAAQPGATVTPPVQAGAWDVRSKVVDLAIPGVPASSSYGAGQEQGGAQAGRGGAGYRGAARTRPQGAVPDREPDRRRWSLRADAGLSAEEGHADAHRPLGSYSATGFVGQAIVTGTTPKGALRIVLDQQASRVGA